MFDQLPGQCQLQLYGTVGFGGLVAVQPDIQSEVYGFQLAVRQDVAEAQGELTIAMVINPEQILIFGIL